MADSPHSIDLEFTRKGEHANTTTLRGLLQERIDAASASDAGYDAVLLGFGLCGNATVGLQARTVPLVVPRAHDCCTLFLGSKERFKEHFADNPSRPFHSTGYSEREGAERAPIQAFGSLPQGVTWESLVEKYGEEDARELVDEMTGSHIKHDREYYIRVPETDSSAVYERCVNDAESRSVHLTVVPGDLRLVRMLLHGDWAPAEFEIIPPDAKLAGVYDWDRVVTAREAGAKQ